MDSNTQNSNSKKKVSKLSKLKKIKKKNIEKRNEMFDQNFTKFGFDFRITTTLMVISFLSIYFILSFLYSDLAYKGIANLQLYIVENLKFIFNFTIIFSLITLILLSLHKKIGKIRIGGQDAVPQFSNIAWYSMLFSAGIGIGILFYAVYEPVTHINSPLFSFADTNTAAITTTVFHWGFSGWAVYGICGVSLAYYAFNKGLPLAPRSFLYPLIGDGIYGIAGDIADALTIVTSLFGLASSLGLGAIQINAGLNFLFNIPMSVLIQIVIISVITIFATISVVSGVDKGVKILSELNMGIALIFFLFIFFASPVSTIISDILKSTVALFVGTPDAYLNQNSFDTNFLSSWTIFYWAWWCSWSIFIGMFIAKISVGRTIREFVFAVLVIPTVFSIIWFGTFGSSALSIIGENPASFDMFLQAPELSLFVLNDFLFSNEFIYLIVNLICLFLIFSFFVTSSDSGSIVINDLAAGGKQKTPIKQKLFWTFTEGGIAVILLYVGGSNALMYLQNSLIVIGIPVTLLLILTNILFVKQIFKDIK